MKSRIAFTLHALAAATTMASLPALAQDNTLESIVVTADRRASELREIPASIYSVDKDAIEMVRATHINEITARIPGTWISRGNGQESLIAIRSPVLSGAGSCGAFQTSLDGIPMRAPGFCNVNQLFEANTEQAGSIEVIRGPGSILYGANALHGAINVISAPVSEDFTGDVTYEVGPHDYNRVSGTVSDTQGAQGYRISANGSSDGGYKHDSGVDQQKLSAIHQYRGTNGFSAVTSFHATNLNQETAGYIEGHDAYKDDDLKRYNPNPESFRDASSYRLSSRLNWEGDVADWTFTPYYRKTDMSFLQHFLPGLPLEENGQKSLGFQAMAASRGTGPLSWISGLDFETTEGYLLETQDTPTEGSAILQATIPVGKHYDFTVDSDLISPYALMKYEVSDADLLSVGLRYEYRKYDYDNRMADGRTQEDGTPCGFGGCRFNRPADRSDTYDNVSAQLGWIHDFDSGHQAYVNVAQAFRAPETNEVYRLQNDQDVADLDSEEARSIEVGYRASIDSFSYAVAAFYMDKENVIFQDSNRENHSGAETRHRGVEWNAAWAINADWRLTFTGTYARHTYAGTLNPGPVNLDGLDIDTAPRLTGSAQLSWQINASNSVELEWIHMGKYYIDEANTASYPGHDLVNLRYQGNWGQGWYYGARITNLFDIDYAERADFGFGNERYFVGEPISLYATLGRRF
jgi:outer membrane receptor protein involved in Fe transport